jgi:hypothetical protein
MMSRSVWLSQVPLATHPPRRRQALSGRTFLGASVSLTDATFNQALSAPQAVVEFYSPT